MKKILIVNNNMQIGGVQKALVNLLWSIADYCDVTLLLFHPGGAYMKEIPPKVKVITLKSAYRFLGMTKYDTLSGWDKLCRSLFAGITKIFGRTFALRLMAIGQKNIDGYDVAISYLHNGGEKLFYGGCNDFVLNHICVKKKITFLHGDYQLCGANTAENVAQYKKFDVIAACSRGCADSLLQVLPELADQVRVVPNCHRFDDISRKAEQEQQEFSQGELNIVTVARLGKEKGVERAIQAIADLGALREKMHYHIVGDGIQKHLLEQYISENSLENTVTLWGMQENPYGYMKTADLLLIPSYSEAAPLVIGESAFLGTPILSTRTSSAREMIEDTGWGWVCDNSVEGIKSALQELLTQPEKLKNIKFQKPNNQAAVAEFIKLIEK